MIIFNAIVCTNPPRPPIRPASFSPKPGRMIVIGQLSDHPGEALPAAQPTDVSPFQLTRSPWFAFPDHSRGSFES